MLWVLLWAPATVLSFSLLFYLFWRITFRKNAAPPSPVVTYHQIDDRLLCFSLTKVDRKRFAAHMRALKERGYSTLTADDFLSLNGAAADRNVLLTFDDSYASVFEWAFPVLSSLNFTATLFVITDYIGKTNAWDVKLYPSAHMTEAQLHGMAAKGFSLGSHTRTHRDLTLLPDRELAEELSGSKKFLEDRFGVAVPFLAYPFGRFDRRVKAAAQAAGYAAAFTINRPLFQNQRDPYAIPVSGVYRTDGVGNFLSKVERNRYAWIEDMKGKILNRFASGAALVKGGE